MPLRRHRIALIIILAILGLAIAALAMKTVNISSFRRGQSDTVFGLKLGLDLQGGTHLVYRATDPNVSHAQMEGVTEIIERRVNAFGLSEPLIQLKGNNEVVIQLPGVRDIEEAKRLIGGTAQLDFRECADPNVTTGAACQTWRKAAAQGSGGVQKELTGAFLRPNSFVQPDPQTGLPTVTFEFNGEGARMFEQITRRLINRPLGIFLDGGLISAPNVRAVISDRGIIEGLPANEARLLSIQLNAGALPVPIQVARQQDVSPTLGKESLNSSYVAGAIGLGLVMVFMVLYYRLLGLVSLFSLGIYYTVMTLAIFKLFPVTLTLSGIAGFVVSVGMAVDAHVLIFERTREELRAGRTLGAAVEAGHERAWAAIRDSNVTLIITMVILWWFGEQLGEPRVVGFAVTLIISVLVSMYTALFVAKTFLRIAAATRLSRQPQLFAPMRREARPGAPLRA